MIKLVKNLKFRLLFALCIILFALFYGFGYAIVHALEHSYRQSTDASLFTVLKDIKHDYVEHPDTIEKMINEVKEEFDMPLLYVQVVSLNLRLNSIDISVRSHDLKKESLNATTELLHDAAQRSDQITFSMSALPALTQRNVRIGTLLLSDKNEHLIFLQCAVPYDKHTPQIKELTLTLWIGFSSLLVVIMVLAYGLMSQSLRNVQKVTNAAKKISTQDSASIIPKTHVAYEIDDLIDTFNTLLFELQHAYAQVKQFGQNASHELKTPLTIMKGEIEVGLRKEREGEEYRTILRNVAKEIILLQEVIEKILFLSSNTSLDLQKHFEEVYIDEILLDALQEKTPLAKDRSIALVVEHLEPLSQKGNPTLLKIAFANIIDNAIKYSPASSTIRIALQGRRLSVQDEGIGISKEDLSHIYEQFYRGKNGKETAKGSGLGLALVKTILDLHGFGIEVSSQEGAYTNISILF
jgi:signal transduction histidine kinase